MSKIILFPTMPPQYKEDSAPRELTADMLNWGKRVTEIQQRCEDRLRSLVTNGYKELLKKRKVQKAAMSNQKERELFLDKVQSIFEDFLSDCTSFSIENPEYYLLIYHMEDEFGFTALLSEDDSIELRCSDKRLDMKMIAFLLYSYHKNAQYERDPHSMTLMFKMLYME